MLENIKFCSCCRLDEDDAREVQCMFFNFTERAEKLLSEKFLSQITEGDLVENLDYGIDLEHLKGAKWTV